MRTPHLLRTGSLTSIRQTMDSVTNYEHLWANSNGPWALLQLNPGRQGTPSFIVINRADRSVLVIEDDEVAQEVKKRMLTAGVPVVWLGNGF